jgi:hypothetical protein
LGSLLKDFLCFMCLKQTGITFLLTNQVVFLMDTQCLLGDVEIGFLSDIWIRFILRMSQPS